MPNGSATTKTTTETAYYLLSSALSPERCNEVARSHWGVENGHHWVLGVTMNEDQNRSRLDHGPDTPMTSNTTVVALRQPDAVEDQLTAVLRDGARRLLLEFRQGWKAQACESVR